MFTIPEFSSSGAQFLTPKLENGRDKGTALIGESFSCALALCSRTSLFASSFPRLRESRGAALTFWILASAGVTGDCSWLEPHEIYPTNFYPMRKAASVGYLIYGRFHSGLHPPKDAPYSET